MRFSVVLSCIAGAGALGLAVATAQESPPVKVSSTSKGQTLVDAKGMTLYTFDKDADGKSACNAQCAANWPPVKADSGAKPTGQYTLLKRDDGSSQWAYKGKPLYTWSKDTKPGDITGDGFLNGAWHVAQP
jgi:predicted lipoprotein with Yx(FWY)xxD motif